jgi:c-di-GMP-binding flagellar brake protein YcgR
MLNNKKDAEQSYSPKEWHYLEEKNPVGGFSYLEIIRLYQNKKISSATMIWKEGMPVWLPMTQVNAFKDSEIARVLKSGIPGVINYFSYREYLRIPFRAKFVIHNEEVLWNGVSFELGAGGLGVFVNSTKIELGQEVFIHKTSRGGAVSVNAVAEAVSKVTNGLRPGVARYGFEFIDIGKDDQDKIQQFTEVYTQTKKIG